MDDLDDDDYRFIRIGEEYDDNESRGAFCENPFEIGLRSDIFMMKPR